MTEVCLDLSFTGACRQQQLGADRPQAVRQQGAGEGSLSQIQQTAAAPTPNSAPPRCAIQRGETFVARGTPASALPPLPAIFADREL